MNFIGTGIKLTEADIKHYAAMYELTPPDIKAVLKVESAGSGFDAKKRLKILPEPHIFFRELSSKQASLSKALAEGLAYSNWGAKPYPPTSEQRYDRLKAMMRIDEVAALRSVSWALPQMMGFNHLKAGFGSVQNMIKSYLETEVNQLRSMLTFIENSNLLDDLREHRWADFARGYNGPGFDDAPGRINDYDYKLQKAWESFT